MSFTIFSNILFGAINAAVAAIVALSGWVPGSAIIQGNLFWDNTNQTNTEYVRIQQTVQHKAGGYNFITNGTQSGIVLQDTAVTAIASKTVTCVGTGGLVTSAYDTCVVPPLLSTTGSIVRVSLMVSASPVEVNIECGLATSGVRSATGTAFSMIRDVTTSTGSIFVHSSTGSIRWPGSKEIKCATGTSPTASFAAKLKVDYFDDTSE